MSKWSTNELRRQGFATSRLSYGRRGGRPPRRHSRTTRERFPLTWLFRIRAFVTGTLCHEQRRDSGREVSAGCRKRCCGGSGRDGAPLSRPLP